ncbi:FMN-binding negative transcriptional regulator [Paraburkholderia bonniea]|uniref:FMN-binding negative transcriptional regulator n=1 Tax=Paraburkholderia bonniea TaxID=2152891 RepID=UPI001291B88D|nr:FMN-binding negative transcriptional regulator [Paraburkholderia bonniea]WJF91778.1 FMN-binding negative transcriptional regulator [Paraburkholderia bonniea]WJF95098.1 FMN-binding negative transcriptional regulator [Paraburkholderia bonniea]
MYLPAHFEENRPEVLHRLMTEHPFATLVTHSPSGLDANHLPFHFDPAGAPLGSLHAHVARANPVWQEVAAQPETLVIFQGPAAYISPNWYPDKHETHRQVPTYNYMVVHAHGRIVVREDEKFLRGLVGRLTRTMEATEAQPWKMSDAPADFMTQMLAAIVGLEIKITRLTGKWKLGQNKAARDRLGAAAALQAHGVEQQTQLAAAMRNATPSSDT